MSVPLVITTKQQKSSCRQTRETRCVIFWLKNHGVAHDCCVQLGFHLNAHKQGFRRQYVDISIAKRKIPCLVKDQSIELRPNDI